MRESRTSATGTDCFMCVLKGGNNSLLCFLRSCEGCGVKGHEVTGYFWVRTHIRAPPQHCLDSGDPLKPCKVFLVIKFQDSLENRAGGKVKVAPCISNEICFCAESV